MIRNRRAQQTRAVLALSAERHIAMSGTPVLKSVSNLYTLFAFLRVTALPCFEVFEGRISRPLSQSFATNREAVERGMADCLLRELLAQLLLRRRKTDLVDGVPIISLPERRTETLYLTLSPEERQGYDAILSRARGEFSRLKDEGKIKFTNVFGILTQLRVACDHLELGKYIAFFFFCIVVVVCQRCLFFIQGFEQKVQPCWSHFHPRATHGVENIGPAAQIGRDCSFPSPRRHGGPRGPVPGKTCP